MKIGRLLSLFLATLTACSHPDKSEFVDKGRFTGRYVYQTDTHDTIDVNSDGTYTNYTWYGKKLENSGTWSYDSLSGRVNFDDFTFLLDTVSIGDSTFLPRGLWSTEIETVAGEIRFIYASDVYKGYFLRVDSVDRKK